MSKVKLIGISGGGLNIVNFLESNFSQNYEQKNIEDLNAILENGEKVYIFCTLAGTTGEKNLLKIKDSFKNYCEKINFVLTTPFIFEGEARVQK
jgi:cell division GTPase FtsZ